MEAVLNITIIMYTVYAIAMFVFIFSLNYYCNNYILSKAKSYEVSESQYGKPSIGKVDLPPVKQVFLRHM